MNIYGGNIPRLYIIKTAKWFSLIMPVIILFYLETGLNMTQIFWLKSIYSIGMLLWEIPSGYFGDVWGRKKTLIAGSILTTIGFSIYGFSSSFWFFALAEFILGIGQSFVSGSDSALLFDSLKADHRENEYLKYEGKVTSVGNFSEAIAGVLGGLLALVSLRTPFIAQAIFSAMAIPASFTLREPELVFGNRVKGFRDIYQVIGHALWRHKLLRQYILLSSVIGTATLTYAWFVQPYFIQIELPVALYGVLWTALNLTVGFSSIFSYRVSNYLGKRNTLIFVVASTVAGFVITGALISVWAIPVLFAFYIARGIATPLMKDYIHVLINSEVRATILSLRNMFIRIFFSIIGPLAGWLTDTFSLRTAFFASALVFLLLGLFFAYPLLRNSKFS